MESLAGLLAIFAALAHSAIGERYIFPKVRIEPARYSLLFRLIWHCLSVGWLCGAALLIGSPALDHRTIGALAAFYAASALSNAVATRWRHFGWMVLAAVSLLTLTGW